MKRAVRPALTQAICPHHVWHQRTVRDTHTACRQNWTISDNQKTTLNGKLHQTHCKYSRNKSVEQLDLTPLLAGEITVRKPEYDKQQRKQPRSCQFLRYEPLLQIGLSGAPHQPSGGINTLDTVSRKCRRGAIIQ